MHDWTRFGIRRDHLNTHTHTHSLRGEMPSAVHSFFNKKCSRHRVQKESQHKGLQDHQKKYAGKKRFRRLHDTRDTQVIDGPSAWDTWKQLETAEHEFNSPGKHPRAKEHGVQKATRHTDATKGWRGIRIGGTGTFTKCSACMERQSKCKRVSLGGGSVEASMSLARSHNDQ